MKNKTDLAQKIRPPEINQATVIYPPVISRGFPPITQRDASEMQFAQYPEPLADIQLESGLFLNLPLHADLQILL